MCIEVPEKNSMACQQEHHELKITNNFSDKYKTWACKTQKKVFQWKWREMQWPEHQDACCDQI